MKYESQDTDIKDLLARRPEKRSAFRRILNTSLIQEIVKSGHLLFAR